MKLKKSYEYVIVGSGFGGAFAAYNLARAGKEVLVVERGKWVERDDSCWDEVRLHLEDPLYRGRTPIIVDQKRGKTDVYWPDDTVGGMSTFYGAAAFRMREEDFHGAPVGDGADRNAESAWPVGYNELEPYYEEAERLQMVAGVMGEDITEPRRSSEFPRRSPDISAPSRRIWDAAMALGLHPARIPLAIDFTGESGHERCIQCHTCDHYLCKICAKSDLSVVVLPEAVKKGAVVADNTRAVRINLAKGRVASVTLADQSSGERHEIRVKRLILAAGALATPHLMLASGIEQEVPRGDLIGRNLMRHANGVVSALLPKKANPDMVFHKFVSIPDFYHGDASDSKGPVGPWGIIQEIHSPERGVLRANTPFGLKSIASFANDYLLNLLCIAEDVPQYSNRVYLDLSEKDMFGMPALMVRHRYAERDLAARAALYRKARKILMKAGALPVYTFPIETFSHAFGTCAFGSSEKSSVLDPDCRVWGIKNLYVTDASVMPSGGSVNPSLTVAANALRVSAALARQ
jgi:choline dehydrogenase-like flavoprotein